MKFSIRLTNCQRAKLLIPVALLFWQCAICQNAGDTLLRLADAVKLAEKNYHLLKAKKLEADAAIKNVEVTKYTRVPSLDASYQAGFGTANNLTGMYYPGGLLPISGPPSQMNAYDPVTGSAASILLNWQAVTFGQRDAQINVSIAEANSKAAEYQEALFRHKIAVISSYLDLVLSYDLVNIHNANIDRVEANLKESRVLTNNGIKPGVDTALFLSELSKAKVDLLIARRQLEISQLALQQLIVIEKLPVPADTSFLRQLPIVTTYADASILNNPIVKYAESQYALNKSRESVLKKSYLPKLNVWGTGFARGSGFQANGDVKTWDGLSLSRFNYGAGLQLVFPILKYGDVKRQQAQQNLLSNAALEKIEESKSVLSTQQQIANVTLRNSIAIAQETGQQLKSGEYAFTAMQIRYNTGLVNFADLIQAQYNLLRAELDGRKAYWDAWKALLLQAAVKGDENYFLNVIGK